MVQDRQQDIIPHRSPRAGPQTNPESPQEKPWIPKAWGWG